MRQSPSLARQQRGAGGEPPPASRGAARDPHSALHVKNLKALAKQYAQAPALFLGRLGPTPNGLTVIGSLLTASVGVLIANGWFVPAGLCLWLFSATDTLDGALARATYRVTTFGAFLDSG